MASITHLDIEACKNIARNSPVLLDMELRAAEGIEEIIYQTAPRTTPHKYAYRDNFRIENRLFPHREGHITYVIAERFQWRWIEYGWTEWRNEKKFRGKHTMFNALEAYGRKGYQ